MMVIPSQTQSQRKMGMRCFAKLLRFGLCLTLTGLTGSVNQVAGMKQSMALRDRPVSVFNEECFVEFSFFR